MSLGLRLNILITVLMLLFMLIVGGLFVNGAKSSIQESVEASTRVTTQLLDAVIISSTQNPEWGSTREILQRFLVSLGHVRSNHIRLYDLRGALTYASPPSQYRANITPPQWFKGMLTPKEKPVIRYILLGRLEIIPDSSGAIREVWSRVNGFLALSLLFFVLLNATVYWMLARWLQPLKLMLTAIRQVELGNLSVRLPNFSVPEFAHIGVRLNKMAKALATERALEENRQLTLIIQNHIEDERRSLARELHDELGQYVTAIKTFAVAIAQKSQRIAPEIEAHAKTIVAAANQIYDGMHDIIRKLRPGSLDNLGLSAALRDTVQYWQRMHPKPRIILDMQGELDSLGELININVYRMVQEALNNAIKHAQAQTVHITAHVLSLRLQLTISDDGIGMNWATVDQGDHFGLLGIKERVQALGGTFQLTSAPQQGTKIYIDIPTPAGMHGTHNAGI